MNKIEYTREYLRDNYFFRIQEESNFLDRLITKNYGDITISYIPNPILDSYDS